MSQSDLVGKVLHDTHRIVRKIGTGGMGSVYEAAHVRLKKSRFAIKVLHAGMVENKTLYARFQQEAEIASELGHPNIVSVTDFYTDRGLPCMVMEYLAGEDLGARLKRDTTLPPAETASMVQQVASALQAVHDRGIIHRDMKPANIFLVDAEQGKPSVKVLDFGISKIRDSSMGLTGVDTVLGTPHFMSPEQAEGANDQIDHRTDIFSLGTITYLALTGKVPFDGASMPLVIHAICTKEAAPISSLAPDLPHGVAQVLERAMAKLPDERYQKVSEFGLDLTLALGAGGPLAAVSTGPVKPEEELDEDQLEDMSQTMAWSRDSEPGQGDAEGPGSAAEDATKKHHQTEVFGIDEILEGASTDGAPDAQGPPAADEDEDDEDDEEEFGDDLMATVLDTDMGEFMAKHAGLDDVVPEPEAPAAVPTQTTLTGAAGEREGSSARKQPAKKNTLPLILMVLVGLAALAGAGVLLSGKGSDPPSAAASGAAAKAAPRAPASKAPREQPKPTAAEPKQEQQAPPPTAPTKTEPEVQQPAPAPAAAPAPAPAPETGARAKKRRKKSAAVASGKVGFLVVASHPQALIYVDGQTTGRKTPVMPSNPLALSPGRHRVSLEVGSKTFGFTVRIKPGEVTQLNKRLPIKKSTKKSGRRGAVRSGDWVDPFKDRKKKRRRKRGKPKKPTTKAPFGDL